MNQENPDQGRDFQEPKTKIYETNKRLLQNTAR